MPLKVRRRKDTGALTITGIVRFPDGTGRRVRKRAASDELQLAREEAIALEAEILRSAWHGERRGSRSLAEAVMSYIESAPRSPATKAFLHRLLRALGDIPLSAVDQVAAVKARRSMLAADASPATYTRNVIVPLRAVMQHAHRLGWCDVPVFEIPKQLQGRTLFLLPNEADQLIMAASPHIQRLLVFLLCTGARMSEALELERRDIDLTGRRAIFWKTKGGKRRIANLPPRAIVALADTGYDDGRVFKTGSGLPYSDRERRGGGQIKTAWKATLRRAGLNSEFSPHTLRHTWASWHYAVYRDLLKLKIEGGWSSVALVERYAHLMPAGHEDEIRRWWGWHADDTDIIELAVIA